ncbi:metallophosphoesterase family protein [Moraxella oblonga]|uniref:metallophosphoesterase family protein n=1 Tax=Moraxella oblonga TaxID=200413 RepID=UPI00082CD4FF|nr:metallophosphoesterase [Moraxella oblonga]
MIRIALFADIHGKFLLPFKLVHHYQQITGKTIDHIIQCGDMGAFPNKNTMDKATLRHAKNDPDELGFLRQFCQNHKEIEQFLNHLNVKMLCVRGNHEDHLFLDNLEKQAELNNQTHFSIDCYQKVWVMRTGVPIILNNGNDQLSLVGIGRIGDKKGRKDSQFIQDYEYHTLKELFKSKQDFDILITHDKPSESIRGYGSSEIRETLNNIAFSYHFYGHTGEPFGIEMADNGVTQSVKIKELEFNQEGKLSEGCMIILEKSGDKIVIEKVPLKDIIGFMKNTWHYM